MLLRGTIEVSKFIIYSHYRVLMDLLIMIKKKWNIRQLSMSDVICF